MAKEKSVINVAGLKKLIKLIESGQVSFDKKKKTGEIKPVKKASGGAAMKKKKGMARGGASMMKKKGMARGGAGMKKKGYAYGGAMKKKKGMARGGMNKKKR